MWETWHQEGRREINTLHVPVGQPVRLTMTSQDVIHSFYIPAFRVKQDVIPGRYTSLWFEATKAGTYHLFCAEYCGTLHSGMVGKVVVMEPADFQQWLQSGAVKESMAVEGQAAVHPVRLQRLPRAERHGPGADARRGVRPRRPAVDRRGRHGRRALRQGLDPACPGRRSWPGTTR